MNPRYIAADVLTGVSSLSTILAWQDQIDWGFRILASLLAITAASLAIHQRLKKPKQRPPLD